MLPRSAYTTNPTNGLPGVNYVSEEERHCTRRSHGIREEAPT
jgi:hypothetical protein